MSSDAHLGQTKQYVEIAQEWDQIAARRDKDIGEGRDITYTHLLAPSIFNMRDTWDGLDVIDVGCGSGHLAAKLGERGASVLGIDISKASIDLAAEKATERVTFSWTSIEDYSAQHQPGRFDVAVANMTLQTTPHLADCVNSITEQLRPDGELIATVPHPWFWPAYWHYEKASWFHYAVEMPIEATFRTSLVPNGVGLTTHFHRPLSQYMSVFIGSGLSLVRFNELIPDETLKQLYPIDWPYPRFLSVKLRRLRSPGARPH